MVCLTGSFPFIGGTAQLLVEPCMSSHAPWLTVANSQFFLIGVMLSQLRHMTSASDQAIMQSSDSFLQDNSYLGNCAVLSLGFLSSSGAATKSYNSPHGGIVAPGTINCPCLLSALAFMKRQFPSGTVGSLGAIG